MGQDRWGHMDWPQFRMEVMELCWSGGEDGRRCDSCVKGNLPCVRAGNLWIASGPGRSTYLTLSGGPRRNDQGNGVIDHVGSREGERLSTCS